MFQSLKINLVFTNVVQSRFSSISFSIDKFVSDDNILSSIVDLKYVLNSLCFKKPRSPDATLTGIVTYFVIFTYESEMFTDR